jgi:conjugal transfer pilus assembly protein TraU
MKKKMMMCVAAMLLALGINQESYALDTCQGKFVNPISDVCWSCLFPMTLGSIEVFGGNNPDTDNPSSPICLCPAGVFYRLGLTVGFWEPIRLVDVTRTPYCMVNLGGLQLDVGKHTGRGEVDNPGPVLGGSFYHVHWYVFPVLYWLNLITDALCVENADFDIAYLTELDPLWQDDELAFILNPEAVLFGNLIAQGACSVDAINTTAGNRPIDALFWCAGAQGSIYPLTGHVQEHIGGVQASTLLSERMAFKMHREGLLWDSDGSSSQSTCYQHPTPILPKSRYRYQMTNPIPTVGKGGRKAFGHSSAIWAQTMNSQLKARTLGI